MQEVENSLQQAQQLPMQPPIQPVMIQEQEGVPPGFKMPKSVRNAPDKVGGIDADGSGAEAGWR